MVALVWLVFFASARHFTGRVWVCPVGFDTHCNKNPKHPKLCYQRATHFVISEPLAGASLLTKKLKP